jgi:hypothetical protein
VTSAKIALGLAGGLCVSVLIQSGCGSSNPVDPDQLAPFVAWLTPSPTVPGDTVFVYETDTTTVVFTAGDDGGVVSAVRVYINGVVAATLTSPPFQTNLDLSSIGTNRSARVWAEADDPTGKTGRTADTLRFVWSPLPDTAIWTMLTPARKPTPRDGYNFTADRVRNRAVLFAGDWLFGTGYQNDVWTFDFITDSWDSVAVANPLASPYPRAYHGAALLGADLLVFGGESDTSLLQDSHLLDLTSMTWRTTTPPTLPTQPVANLYAVSWAGEVWAYGGRLLQALISDQLWNYSGSSGVWSITTGHPPGQRAQSALAVSSENGTLFLFGGVSDPATNVPADASNFRLDLNTQTWASTLAPGPPPLAEASAVYDSTNNRILMWGGRDAAAAHPTAVWEFSMGALRWRQVPVSGPTPTGRLGHQLVMDEASGRVILFGGRVGGVGTDDTWQLTW